MPRTILLDVQSAHLHLLPIQPQGTPFPRRFWHSLRPIQFPGLLFLPLPHPCFPPSVGSLCRPLNVSQAQMANWKLLWQIEGGIRNARGGISGLPTCPSYCNSPLLRSVSPPLWAISAAEAGNSTLRSHSVLGSHYIYIWWNLGTYIFNYLAPASPMLFTHPFLPSLPPFEESCCVFSRSLTQLHLPSPSPDCFPSLPVSPSASLLRHISPAYPCQIDRYQDGKSKLFLFIRFISHLPSAVELKVTYSGFPRGLSPRH